MRVESPGMSAHTTNPSITVRRLQLLLLMQAVLLVVVALPAFLTVGVSMIFSCMALEDLPPMCSNVNFVLTLIFLLVIPCAGCVAALLCRRKISRSHDVRLLLMAVNGVLVLAPLAFGLEGVIERMPLHLFPVIPFALLPEVLGVLVVVQLFSESARGTLPSPPPM